MRLCSASRGKQVLVKGAFLSTRAKGIATLAVELSR
jgi:hypothetical protein